MAEDRFSNYKPILLLTSVSEILERTVHKRLYLFPELHDFLITNGLDLDQLQNYWHCH